jgi:hypothetical protein
MFVLLLVLLAFAGGALFDAALAQTQEPSTRSEALRREREEKQGNLTPNRPDTLQRAMDYVEDRALFLLTKDGFYPKIGTLTTGSGFAFGLGYRDRDMLKRRGVAEAWAAGTPKQYWAIQGRLIFPETPRPRFTVDAVANLRDYPKEAFYGLGPDAERQDELEFGLRTSELAGRAGVRPVDWFFVAGGLGLYSPKVSGTQIDYTRSRGYVEVDYREPLNARRGGWYRLDVSHYDDRNNGRRTFTRTDLDVRQFLGMLADRRVLAVRGWLSTTAAPGDSNGVPFYLMPTLGGNDSLRGFRNYRFRGPHAILVQAEYRWEIWSGLDAAFFYDAGKVAMQRADLNFKNLEDDYGFGFRFNTASSVILRVDAAFGSRDGKHLHVVFGGVF